MLDPLLDHIGNVLNWTCRECSILNSVMKALHVRNRTGNNQSLAQPICFPFSVQNYFGRCMTRPYTRACRQTNFSEGEFVNKVPFYFFLFFLFFLPSLFSFSNVFCPFVLFSSGFMATWEAHLITQGRWVVNFRLIICQNDCIRVK